MSILDERVKFLEHKMQILANEMNGALNELATLITGMTKMSRMYQAAVELQLDELRKHTGLVLGNTEGETDGSDIRESVPSE